MLGTSSVCSVCGKPGRRLPSVSQTALRRTAPPLPLREYLKEGWELFTRYPGGFIGFLLVCLLIEIASKIIPIVGPVAGFAVSAPLFIGNFIVSAKLVQDRTPEFRDFFLGFRFFVPLLLTALVGGLLTFVGLLLLIIPGIYLGVSYLFAKLLVVDRSLDFWPALELSRRSVRPIWFSMFGFALLLALVNFLGLIALVVGVLVTIPVSCCAVTAAYADLFGFKSDYSEGFPDNLPAEPETTAP